MQCDYIINIFNGKNNSDMTPLKFNKNAYGKKSYYAVIYSVKKNGERYKRPMAYNAYGTEKSQEDVLARLQRLNPDSKFEIA